MVVLSPGIRYASRNGLSRMQRTLTTLPSHYVLPSGDEIPAVALGCWRSARDDVGEAVKTALKAGYRHIDGAWIYGNEAEVGQALRYSGVPRREVWLTSKLWNAHKSPEDVEPALDDTLTKLGTDYLDLYLIHWPVAKKDGQPYDKALTANPYPTWQKMEEMVAKGKVRNIGVSNFNIPKLENLTANPLKIKPAVNQVELNFWLPQPELLEYATRTSLLLSAYSPLGSQDKVKATLAQPEVQAIAQEMGMTRAQVVLSWHVQRGTVVLPKSVTPARVVENLQVRALPPPLFDKLEAAARAHPPSRGLNPSESWLDYDMFA